VTTALFIFQRRVNTVADAPSPYAPYDSDPRCRAFVEKLKKRYRVNVRRAYVSASSCVVDFEHGRLRFFLRGYTGPILWYTSSAVYDMSAGEVEFNLNRPLKEGESFEVELPPSDSGYRVHLIVEKPYRIGVKGRLPVDQLDTVLEYMLR